MPLSTGGEGRMKKSMNIWLMTMLMSLLCVAALMILQGCKVNESDPAKGSADVTETGLESFGDESIYEAMAKDGFVLTYNDEFEGDSLNKDFWYPNLPHDWGTISLNDEAQGYTEDNVVIEDGLMKLVLEKQEVEGLKNGKNKTFGYASGCVNTYNKIYQKYGVWEIRAKLPSVLGAWPAFWLMPENGNVYSPVGAEIDVFENLSFWGDEIQFGVHYDGYGEDHQHYAAPKITVNDLLTEFHVYTLEWHPDYLRFFVDGQLVADYTGRAVPTSEQYVILNAAMGGWGGDIDDAGLIDTMEIDYMRIYQYEDMTSIESAEAAKLNSLKTEAKGLDFELHQLSDIVRTAGLPIEVSYIELTDDDSEVCSGKVSYKADTTGISDGMYDVYVSPVGAMAPMQTYTVSFDYKILEKSKEDKFYYYVTSVSDPTAKVGYRSFDPATGASDGSGVMNTVSYIVSTGDIDDAVFVFGIENQAAIALDNIDIEKYQPPSAGFDFEDISIESIVAEAANRKSYDYGVDLISLTTDPMEVISGSTSFKADAAKSFKTWNEIYHSSAGTLEANKTYEVSFNYKILHKGGDTFFYTLGRSLSKEDGAPDLLGWYEWYDETGSQGEITTTITVPDYDDYYLIIGIYKNGAMVIDNIVYEEQ